MILSLILAFKIIYIYIYLEVYVCVHECVCVYARVHVCVRVCFLQMFQGAHVKVRRKLEVVGSRLLLSGSWRLNSDFQAWQQMPSPTKLS